MPSDYDENAPNEGEFIEYERDSYDILAEWMVDKQGDDGDHSWQEIRDTLEANGVVDDDGSVDLEAMASALDALELEYDGYDAESWRQIIDHDSP